MNIIDQVLAKLERMEIFEASPLAKNITKSIMKFGDYQDARNALIQTLQGVVDAVQGLIDVADVDEKEDDKLFDLGVGLEKVLKEFK